MSKRMLYLTLVALAGMFCSALAPAAGFSDPDFRRAALRSDYAPGYGSGAQWLDLWYAGNGLPGAEGCLFDAADTAFACPGRATERDDGTPAWLGLVQRVPACGGDPTRIGDSWLGCLSYRESRQFALNRPGANYWKVLANLDPSFDQCRRGPPNLSDPIGTLRAEAPYEAPRLFKVGTERLAGGDGHRVHLMIDADAHDFGCERAGPDPQEGVPFLSVGAAAGHGNAGPVAHFALDRPGASVIGFEAQLLGYQQFQCPLSDCPAGSAECYCARGRSGARAGVYLVAEWGGLARMLMIELLGAGVHDSTADAPARSGFNWPIVGSVLWPGSDLVLLTTQQIARDCPQVELAPLSTRRLAYRLDVAALFACAGDSFLTPPPASGELALTQMHWFTETYGTRGHLWWSIERPRSDAGTR